MKSTGFVEKMENSRKNSLVPEQVVTDVKIPPSGRDMEDLNDSEEYDKVVDIADAQTVPILDQLLGHNKLVESGHSQELVQPNRLDEDQAQIQAFLNSGGMSGSDIHSRVSIIED